MRGQRGRELDREGGQPLAAVTGNTETRVNCAQGERSEYISTLQIPGPFSIAQFARGSLLPSDEKANPVPVEREVSAPFWFRRMSEVRP